jgi:DNA mismatch repair protein MutS2
VKLFPQDTASRFEFNKVIDRVAAISQSHRAKDFAMALTPVSEEDTIVSWLSQTAEALEIIDNGIYFPPYAFPNIQHELSMLGIENAVLEGQQVIKLRKVAEVAASVIRFLAEKKELYPHLRGIVDGLYASKELIATIDAVLEPNGFVKSSASKELAAARKALGEARQKANKAFEAAVRKYKRLGWLREFDESFYNDRRVLAVVAEHKRQIDGTLHGSSETGSTAFIEPANLVSLNNDVAEALQREQREEYRILRQLSGELRTYKAILESYEYALGFLDFTFAKARYAREVGGVKPLISKEKDIILIDASHPVLLLQNRAEQKKTIPLTIELDHNKRILIISGPNAGGKSVSLKTFGLLQIMFQSGLLVPAADHSRFAIFKQLFVDIGDDQSIAYELSTYSSRLLKMKHFLFHAHKNTLFFIDEFGTGSDPELGGAIAETILEELANTKAFGMITTHYSNIKILAEEHPNMVNGCMLFDEATLQPKYQLHIGHAGSSYTFEVAQKIGLEQRIIDSAKEKLDGHKVKLDRLLITLQTKKNALNKETSLLQKEKSLIRKEIESYSREAEEFKRMQDDLNFQENKKLIEKGKKYEALLESWKDKSKRKEIASKLTLTSERDAARKIDKDKTEKLREKQARIKEQRASRNAGGKETKAAKRKPIEVGDSVRLGSSKQVGVVEEIHKDKITVVFGMMRTIVQADKLQHLV